MYEDVSHHWRTGLIVFAVVLVVYCVSPATQEGDSYLTFPTAWTLVHHGSLYLNGLNIPPQFRYGEVSVNGHLLDNYPWINALWMVPAIGALDLLHVAHVTPSSTTVVDQLRTTFLDAAQLLTASVITALAATVLFAVVVGRFRARSDGSARGEQRARRLAMLVTFTFAFATSAWSTASRAVWQHGPSLLMLALAVYFADRLDQGRGSPGRNAIGLGAAIALAYEVRPTNAVPVVVISVWVLLRRHKLMGWYLAGAVVPAVPWLAVNLVVFRSLVPPYYAGGLLSLNGSYPQAFAANLVSPSRGLLIFAPIVVLGGVGFVIGRESWSRALDPALAVCVVGHLLLIAANSAQWWGGYAYGPRLTTDILVYAAVLAVPAVDRIAWPAVPLRHARVTGACCVVLLAWSVYANGQGALTRTAWCWNVTPVSVDSNYHRVWSWSAPQWDTALRSLASTHSVAKTVLGHCAAANASE